MNGPKNQVIYMHLSVQYGSIKCILEFLKDIIVSCVSNAEVLDNLGMLFLHLMCKSYICWIFFVSMLNGFIPLFKVLFLVLLYLYMSDMFCRIL